MHKACDMNEGTIVLERAIDARKLMYFAMIVQHGSLGKAAKALRISQPALSVAMDKLEKSLDAKLLKRTRSGIEPTETGETIVRHARRILESVFAVEEELFMTGNGAKGVLRFGCLPTLAGSVIPQAIRRWHENYPDFELEVTERPQNELLWGLLRREIDFSVGVVDQDNNA